MRESRTPGSARGAGGNFRPYRDRCQALISWVTRRTKRRDRIEMKAISMKATRCSSSAQRWCSTDGSGSSKPGSARRRIPSGMKVPPSALGWMVMPSASPASRSPR